MVFKKLLSAFGVGGPSVETVLTTPRCRPGDYLSGEVRIGGGDHDVQINQVVLSLITRVETEQVDYESSGSWEFHRHAIAGSGSLGAGQNQTIPFQLSVPWESPLTEVYGQHLHGMMLGVRTELEIAGAIDKGDLDPISVAPLPTQQRILDAFMALGFRFKSADVEQGRKAGFDQRLPFYQEIEFYAPPQYSGRIDEVELTFAASPYGLSVVLEADRRATIFSEGHDGFGRYQVTHEQALHMAWEPELDRWLQAMAANLGGHGHGMPYGHQEPNYHGHEHAHGPGWDGVAAGAVVHETYEEVVVVEEHVVVEEETLDTYQETYSDTYEDAHENTFGGFDEE